MRIPGEKFKLWIELALYSSRQEVACALPTGMQTSLSIFRLTCIDSAVRVLDCLRSSFA
jgi:hypothetical protein